MRRIASAGLLLVLMSAFGLGVYHLLDAHRSRTQQGAGTATPTTATGPVLAGSIYLAQGGSIYQFQKGRFKKLTAAEGWMQPAASPDGTRLVAVKRGFNSSDLFLLGTDGRVQAQLTHNFSTVVEWNHWAFFPRFSPDGGSVFYSYDPKDPGNTYRVDMAVYALPLNTPRPVARAWTYPNQYTGGDVSPAPLRSGGLVYSKFASDGEGKVYSQVWIQGRAGSPGLGLTKPEDNCGQPAVSPSQTSLVVVCHPSKDVAVLEAATLDAAGYAAGPLQAVVSAPLLASPGYSPDGLTVAYFAPTSPGRPFQLWTVSMLPAAPASATPGKPPVPRVIGPALGWDSGSAPVWV